MSRLSRQKEFDKIINASHRAEVEQHLKELYLNAVSCYNDGWTASDYKKDLVMIQFMLNRLIKKYPNFGKVEEEWEKEMTFEILKED